VRGLGDFLPPFGSLPRSGSRVRSPSPAPIPSMG
jgi:hypothetical protein